MIFKLYDKFIIIFLLPMTTDLSIEFQGKTYRPDTDLNVYIAHFPNGKASILTQNYPGDPQSISNIRRYYEVGGRSFVALTVQLDLYRSGIYSFKYSSRSGTTYMEIDMRKYIQILNPTVYQQVIDSLTENDLINSQTDFTWSDLI